MVSVDLKRFCRRLGYHFKNEALLKQALTHCSVGDENYERLEFLGDSILSFVMAYTLFRRFPEESEGQLSRLRAFLVKGDTLAEIALQLGLGDYLFLGPGELRSGGFRRSSILADAMEAIFAAVYIDGGLDASEQVILSLYEERLHPSQLQNNLKDPKTQLQEFLQAKKMPLPEYQLLQIEGAEHEQVFHVSCSIPRSEFITYGVAKNRRKAEQEAATLLLEFLYSQAGSG